MIEINKAELKHAEGIVDLIVEGAHEGSFDPLNVEEETLPHLKKDIESIISHGRRTDEDLEAYALVFTEEEQLAGFAVISDMPPQLPGRELYGYYIAKAFRGKGHGRQLLQEILERVKLECRDFFVRCRPDAEVMYKLLQDIGFVDVGHTEVGARILHKVLA